MDERELAETLLVDHLLAAAALTSLQIHQLSDSAQAHLTEVILAGKGWVELRTRIDGGQVELVLVPADDSEPLWLTRMGGDRGLNVQ